MYYVNCKLFGPFICRSVLLFRKKYKSDLTWKDFLMIRFP